MDRIQPAHVCLAVHIVSLTRRSVAAAITVPGLLTFRWASSGSVLGKKTVGAKQEPLAISTAICSCRNFAVVGSAAKTLFGIGLLGASLLAGAVLPLATAYAICEAFGLPKGLNLFTGLIVIGAVVALIPSLPLIKCRATGIREEI